MGSRGRIIILGSLLLVVSVIAVYLLAFRPERSSRASGNLALSKAHGAVKAPRPKPAELRPIDLPAKEREAWAAETRKPEKIKELVAVAEDRQASSDARLTAARNLAAANVGGEVLFPLAVKLSAEEGLAFKSLAVEMVVSLLERGETIADEAQATPVLCAAAKSDDKAMRNLAARGLGRLGGKLAAEAMVGLLSDGELLVRKSAIEGLQRISSGTFGYDFAVKAADQREAIEKWAAWAKTYVPKAPQG